MEEIAEPLNSAVRALICSALYPCQFDSVKDPNDTDHDVARFLQQICKSLGLKHDLVERLVPEIVSNAHRLYAPTAHYLEQAVYPTADLVSQTVGDYDRWLSDRNQELEYRMQDYSALAAPLCTGSFTVRFTMIDESILKLSRSHLRLMIAMKNNDGIDEEETKIKEPHSYSDLPDYTFRVQSMDAVFVLSIVDKRKSVFGQKITSIHSIEIPVRNYVSSSSMWGSSKGCFDDGKFIIEVQFKYRDYALLASVDSKTKKKNLDVSPYLIQSPRDAYVWIRSLVGRMLDAGSGNLENSSDDDNAADDNADDDDDELPEGLLVSDDMQWLLEDMCLRYMVPLSHFDLCWFAGFSAKASLCTKFPAELHRLLLKARDTCVGASRKEIVLIQDSETFESCVDVLLQRMETAISNFKSYPVRAFVHYLAVYASLMFMDTTSPHFLDCIVEHVRTAIRNHYSGIKEEANVANEGAIAFTKLLRVLFTSLEADLSIYAIEVFPADLNYLHIVAETIYPLVTSDLSSFLQRRDLLKGKFDPAMFQMSQEYARFHTFWKANMPAEFTFDFSLTELLRPHFEMWITETRSNFKQWIMNAFMVDKWVMMGEEAKHSSSVVDTAKLCETVITVIRSASLNEFKNRTYDMICEACVSYISLVYTRMINNTAEDKDEGFFHLPTLFFALRDKLSRNESGEETPKSVVSEEKNRDKNFSAVSPKEKKQADSSDALQEQEIGEGQETESEIRILVQVNSMFHCVRLMEDMRDRFLSDDELNVEIEIEDSPNATVSLSQQHPLVIFSRFIRQGKQLVDKAVMFLSDRLKEPIRESLLKIADKPDSSTPAEDRCEYLFQTLERVFNLYSDVLYEDVFCKFIRLMLGMVMNMIEDLFAADDPDQRLKNPSPKHARIFTETIPLVVDFFYVDGVRIKQSLVDECTRSVHQCLLYAGTPTKSLLDIFYRLHDKVDEDSQHLAAVIINIFDVRKSFDHEASAFVQGATQESDLKVQSIFKLGKAEQVTSSYLCQNADRDRGKIYVTNRHICWKSYRRSEDRFLIPISEIQDIDLGERGLEIVMQDSVTRYQFIGFSSSSARQSAFNDIIAISKKIGNDLDQEQKACKHISPDRSYKMAVKYQLNPDAERLVDSFACTIRLAIPSVLYIFSTCFVFASHIPLVGKQYTIHFSQVKSIKKCLLRAIEFTLLDGRQILATGFMNQENAFKRFMVSAAVAKIPWNKTPEGDCLFFDETMATKGIDEILAEAHEVRDESVLRDAVGGASSLTRAREVFDISADEKFFAQFSCVRDGDQGFLFLFSKHLCFDSILFSNSASKVVLPHSHIRSVVKRKDEAGIAGKGLVITDRDKKDLKFSSFNQRGECYRTLKLIAAEAGAVFQGDLLDNDKRDSRHLELFRRLCIPMEEEVKVEYHCFSSMYLKGMLYVCTNCIIFDPLFLKSHAFTEKFENIKQLTKSKFMRLSIEFTRYDGSKFALRGFKRRNDAFAAVVTQARLLGIDMETSRPSEEALRKREENIRANVIKSFSIPSSEMVLGEFYCMRGIHGGFMYITTSYVCFDSSVRPGRPDVMIAMSIADIARVDPVRKLFAPSGLDIITKQDGRPYKLHGFVNRNDAYRLIVSRMKDVKRLYDNAKQSSSSSSSSS
eukprot:ANDGO_07005.mRNA.1 hypothetical protein